MKVITTADIRNAIKTIGARVDAEAMSVSVPFKDMGLDSLDRYNLFIELEQITETEIPDEAIADLQTIEAIVKYLNGVG